jgi:hypothetical protein
MVCVTQRPLSRGRIAALIAVSLLALATLGVGAAISTATGSIVGVVVAAVGGVLLMIMAVVIGAVWMRSIDEAAQEAHKWAWYWGGSTGLAVGGVGVVLATLPDAARWTPPAFFHGRTDAVAWMVTGAFGLMTLMVIGYCVAWALWWVMRR